MITRTKLLLTLLPLVAIAGLNANASAAAIGFECAGYRHPGEAGTDGIAAKRVAPAVGGVPVSGSVRVLVIFAKFEDESGKPLPPVYADDIFDPELPGSFTHFYDAMSFGQLKVEGTVLPKRYTASKTASAYLAPAKGAMGHFGELVLDILEQADRDVDFAQFDNDGPDGLPNSGDDSGTVDYVFVNLMSTPRGFIRDGATGVAELGFSNRFSSRDMGIDSKPIRVVGMIGRGAVLQEGTFSQTVGAMAHEFGHSLRLPDLYDLEYSDPAEDSAGIGRWGLMGWGAHGWNGDDGPNPLSAWCREELGWLGTGNQQLVELSGDATDLELRDVNKGGSVYKIPLGVTGKPWFDSIEYLLFEYRSRSGSYYDRKIPAAGVLVWHTRPRIFKISHDRFQSTPESVLNLDETAKEWIWSAPTAPFRTRVIRWERFPMVFPVETTWTFGPTMRPTGRATAATWATPPIPSTACASGV